MLESTSFLPWIIDFQLASFLIPNAEVMFDAISAGTKEPNTTINKVSTPGRKRNRS